MFDPNLELIGTLDVFISSVWKEEYQDKGSFHMVCSDIPENVRLLKEGNRLWQRGKRTCMIIYHYDKNSTLQQIRVDGYTSLFRLNKRVIRRNIEVTNVERGMKQMITDNLRNLPYMTVSPYSGLTESVDMEFTDDEINEAHKKLAKESQLGYYMYFDYKNKRDEFRVYKGSDYTTGDNIQLFKEEFGNLPNMRIIGDWSLFKNVAYVKGAGEGDQRAEVIVGDAAGDDRYEITVDARDLQPDPEKNETNTSQTYLSRLRTRGLEKINERINVQTFEAQIDAPQFGTDFYLGDVVTCVSTRYGTSLNTRITAYEEVTENNVTKRILTFGEPEITAFDEMRIRYG